MLEFEYEQGQMENARSIYKFDHEPICDEQWHALRSGARSFYRVVDGRLQFVNLKKLSAAEGETILSLVTACGLLDTDDEVEVLIRQTESGFEMTSHWLFLGAGSRFSAFTSEQWNAAYRLLRELEEHAC